MGENAMNNTFFGIAQNLVANELFSPRDNLIIESIASGTSVPSVTIEASSSTGKVVIKSLGTTTDSVALITSPTGTGGITLVSGSGGITLAAGKLKITPLTSGSVATTSSISISNFTGKITLTGGLAATTSATFTVSNSLITTSSVVFVSAESGFASIGTTTVPVTVSVNAISSGSFTVLVRNNDSSTAAPVIHYWIINSS